MQTAENIKPRAINIAAYVRVSTDRQDAEKQWHGIIEYANRLGYSNVGKIEDTASGRVSWEKRTIGKMIEQFGEGDIILASEVSRLARSTKDILEILEQTAKKGIEVHIVKQNLVFRGEGDMTSHILATILGMVAQIEREFTSQRTKEALAKVKADGKVLGRPKGVKQARVKLDDRRDEIVQMLNAGASKRSIAKIVECTPPTLYAWIKREKKRIKQQKKSNLTPADMEFLGQKAMQI